MNRVYGTPSKLPSGEGIPVRYTVNIIIINI